MSKALMTIHGYLTDTNDFGKLYEHLAEYDEVYKLALPGHGGQVNMDLFTVEDTQRAVMNAFDTLAAKHDEVDVVGFSLGGALTTWLCSLRNVHRAVLLSPANKYINMMMPWEAAKFYGGMTVEAYRQTDGNLHDKAQGIKRAWAPYGENIGATGKVARNRSLRYFALQNFKVFSELVRQANMWVQSVRPAMPTLVLWGKLDELVPFKSVEFIHDNFQNVTVRVYPDVGHALLYTNRDAAIIQDVTDFLKNGTLATVSASEN